MTSSLQHGFRLTSKTNLGAMAFCRMNQQHSFEKARTKSFLRRVISLPDGRRVEVALLIREEDGRPLDAPWWREKQAGIIGADFEDTFFLRRCDGSVRYWEHKHQSNTVVAPSAREFARKLEEGEGSAANASP